MNERIKELALQCGAWHQVYDEKRLLINEYFNYEKLAELVIKECIEVVKPTQHHEAWAPSYLGGVDGLELLNGKIKIIKTHFGIEN
jgi:hypothetical protein